MLFNSTCDAFNKSVSFFYNETGKPISASWRTHDFIVVGLGVPICVFIILANMLVIVAIIINRQFHFPIYYLLGNMAAADLFAGISYLNLVFNTGPWTIKLSVNEWFIRGALINMSLTASVVNLLAVALERHQTIFTMQLHSTMTKRRVVMLIVTIWLVAVFMGLVPIMGWNCVCDLSTCCTVAPLYSRSFLVFWAILNLMAFFIMVAVYTHIFIYVRRRSRVMSPHMDQPSNNQTVISLMKTMSMILGAFVICWTPGLVILLLDGLSCGCQVLKYEKYCLVLAECNSLVNPIIYSFRDKDMRTTYKRILCFPWRRMRQHEGASGIRFESVKTEALLEKNSNYSTSLEPVSPQSLLSS
ncbi:lysophosphatidic acid receptor 1-like [Carassius auratus]|uniref:Lysophosphatidic acid receptor 1-like n=1 Tax=Carassius auratus TaxID=7957 RepID=A0A6P6K5K6_CARAU|nr:lysophosphatidic acid receptor 1-like [Carassius auratus]XP_026067583.1 lysophosphatidic acid receptor 1-like [Carassius auratus]XP_052407925.1 lysophosphatidic acid receptor 1 [Carassius gibelio]XP_052407933.1 lysophosphatidic acid receptor 1 [Carassius gibelio]